MFGTPRALTRLAAAALLLAAGSAYELDPNSTDSVISIAKNMADDLLSFYDGDKPGGTPGLLPQPYYWWEAGSMLGALVDYWYYTGDDSYNKLITDGLLLQVGENNDYMPRNQTLTAGNDDQGFWGLAVMSAAENSFPDPPANKPQWLGLAQAVFNTQAARWDENECAGVLRWQIFHWNKGYDYKNSISQACFFALGARLALYTGNDTYADWADKTWDWMISFKYIDEHWRVFDGAHVGENCTTIVPFQFTYNAGGDDIGRQETLGLCTDITAGDRAGAAIITIVAVACMLVGILWIFLDESSDKGPLDQCKGFNMWATASLSSLGGSQVYDEKNVFVVGSVGERGRHSSSEINQAIEEAPIKIGRVRNQNLS